MRVNVPEDAVATPGARIFIQAPQYHWHSSGAEGIDGEARERLVALEALSLVDRQRPGKRSWPTA